MSTSTREAVAVLLYGLGFVAYLSWHPEGELLHWVTLVVIPIMLLRALRSAEGVTFGWDDVAVWVGMDKRPTGKGIGAALIVGILVSGVQLAGRNGEAIRAIIASGRVLYLWPLSFLLMVATAATTEELFFRGIVQKRLAAALGSQWPAIGVAAILFALYHVPYAYHNPAWGVAGDFRGALEAAAATGLPLGVLLGAVFAIAGERTAASIAAHALINALPGMVIVQRLIGA